jgi:alkaline phosphatase D
MNRRAFLTAAVAAAVAAACGGDDNSQSATATSRPPPTTDGSTTSEGASLNFASDPFSLGVASGDPLADAVILWTRLAPEPQVDGGVLSGADDIEVGYVIATDETLGDVVGEGTATALAALGHSIHLDATGLDADTTYYYQFRVGGFTSHVGRTRTLAALGTTPDSLSFAFSSCQNWESGEYAAYRDIVDNDDIDLFVFLGDYIYEYASSDPSDEGTNRRMQDFEAENLEQYRQRYALYKSDLHLQAAHGLVPWLITWDDHEVENNYAAAASEEDIDEAAFLDRRAAAYQAWYEHMPVRLDPPEGPDLAIYHSVSHGDLVTFHVLDARQYRAELQDDEPFIAALGSALQVRNDELAVSPDQTMLGDAQETWLFETAAASNAVWDVLAQPVFMFGANIIAGTDPPTVVVDTWDGYAGARQRLLETVGASVDNLVVLSGDFHSAAVADLRVDPFDTSLPVVGSEFMAGPISSEFFDGDEAIASLVQRVLSANKHIKTFDPRRGYIRCEITADRWLSEIRSVIDPFDADSQVRTTSRWEIAAGTPGAVQAP